MQIAIHSDLDPLSRDSNETNAVYRSSTAEITWPTGEVLDFTPRASITLPAMTVEEAQFYEYRARISGWGVRAFAADGRTYAANGSGEDDRDMMGRSGCRQGSAARSGIDGCAYAYIGGEDATRPVDQQRKPTETEMASQAHVYWSAQRPASMRADVYTFRVRDLTTTTIAVQVQVVVDVVSRETGAVLRTETMLRDQVYTVRLVAPRSAK
nr:MAG: hypothetical protein DIU80_10320 [Chloroflexota bacterium]